MGGTAAVALALAGIFAILSPPERSLGSIYRLVLFHGGLAVVAYALLGLVGVVGAVALVRPSARADALVASGQETAALAFVLYFISSYVAMVKAWFGPVLEEPRFAAAAWILFIGGAAFVASVAVHRPRFRALMAAGVGALALYLLAVTPLFFHPKNPVRSSGVLGAKVAFYAIVAASAVSAAAFWAYRLEMWRRHHETASVDSPMQDSA